jgi:hypothetical protein
LQRFRHIWGNKVWARRRSVWALRKVCISTNGWMTRADRAHGVKGKALSPHESTGSDRVCSSAAPPTERRRFPARVAVPSGRFRAAHRRWPGHVSMHAQGQRLGATRLAANGSGPRH